MSATPVFDFPGVFADELLFTTRVTLDGGSDKNQPPGSELWMTTPLRTIAEQVYDDRATRQNKRTKNWSAQARGHPIGVRGHHSSPDRSRVDTLSNGLIDRPSTEVGEGVIGREAARVRGAEGLFEALPEVRQPHLGSLLRHATNDLRTPRRRSAGADGVPDQASAAAPTLRSSTRLL
jgi:hypothetical protein